jgi:hypothetical protein
MGEFEKHGRLEIDEHFEHHVRWWRLKRIVWALLALLIAAALAGFLGSGPSSKAITRTAGLQIDYDRIVRYNAPAHLLLTVPGGKEDLELSIQTAFVKNIELSRIDPEPKEMRLSGDTHTWVFPRREERSAIFINYRPQAFGSQKILLHVKDADAMQIQQFCLP